MLQHDNAPLTVLFIGGTGTISASCVRLANAAGMQVTVLNRGANRAGRELPASVEQLTADVADEHAVATAIGERRFDSVVNFLSYDDDDVQRMLRLFSAIGAGTSGNNRASTTADSGRALWPLQPGRTGTNGCTTGPLAASSRPQHPRHTACQCR